MDTSPPVSVLPPRAPPKGCSAGDAAAGRACVSFNALWTSSVEVVDPARDLLRVCTPLISEAPRDALCAVGFFVGASGLSFDTPGGLSWTLAGSGTTLFGLGSAEALAFAFVPLGGMLRVGF